MNLKKAAYSADKRLAFKIFSSVVFCLAFIFFVERNYWCLNSFRWMFVGVVSLGMVLMFVL